MPMRRGQGRWSKMLRRGTALFLTTVTVWVLSLTADMGAAAQTFQTLAESPAFVSAALRAELGNLTLEDDPMNGLEGWQRLVLRQSPALMAFEGGPDLLRGTAGAGAGGHAGPLHGAGRPGGPPPASGGDDGPGGHRWKDTPPGQRRRL